MKRLKSAFALMLAWMALLLCMTPASAAKEGLTVLIVLDNSRSMIYADSNKSVTQHLKNVIIGLDKNDSVGIALFDGAYTEIAPITSLSTYGSVLNLCNKLDSINYNGNYTDVWLALNEANNTLMAHGKVALIFISDGGVDMPGSAALSKQDAINASQKQFRELAQSLEYPLYPIFVGNAQDCENLMADTSIPYFYSESSDDLPAVFNSLVSHLKNASYTLDIFCVSSDIQVIDLVKPEEEFAVFVQFQDGNSNTLTSPYMAQCTALLEIDEQQYPMILTDEGTAFFWQLSFDSEGEYEALVKVTHEFGQTYTQKTVIVVVGDPDQCIFTPTLVFPVYVLGFLATICVAVKQVAKKHKQPVSTPLPYVLLQYSLVDEFNKEGPLLTTHLPAKKKIALMDILTSKDNAKYIFHDINNIYFCLSKNGRLAVENTSRYKIYLKDDTNNQPTKFELDIGKCIKICPVGDINAATILISPIFPKD